MLWIGWRAAGLGANAPIGRGAGPGSTRWRRSARLARGPAEQWPIRAARARERGASTVGALRESKSRLSCSFYGRAVATSASHKCGVVRGEAGKRVQHLDKRDSYSASCVSSPPSNFRAHSFDRPVSLIQPTVPFRLLSRRVTQLSQPEPLFETGEFEVDPSTNRASKSSAQRLLNYCLSLCNVKFDGLRATRADA